MLKLSAPAKINLFLEVVGRREDGYHLLRTLMCCVSLLDTLNLEIPAPCNKIICTNRAIPKDEGNLAYKALLLFNHCLKTGIGIFPHNVSIELTKNIPVGAGLGGGSSDAATVLRGLNRYYKMPFAHEQLIRMALQLGADVPFFIDQKPAFATGIGEKLASFNGLPPMAAVLIYPGFPVSTAEVFKNLNLRLTKCEKKLRYFPFKNGKFEVGYHLCNDLETLVAERFPVIEEMKKELLKAGALGALMTGSGSTVFGLYPNLGAACKAKDQIPRHDGWQIFCAELLTEPLIDQFENSVH